MSVIHDIAINLAASAIWALGGFIVGKSFLKKSINKLAENLGTQLDVDLGSSLFKKLTRCG
jgi:hypothetical protein